MKKNLWLVMLMAGIACFVFGCAAMTGIPRGSVLIGVYKGTFDGAFNAGSVELRLYQAPDGSKTFTGYFDQLGSSLQFRGTVQEDELRGQILLPVEGPISGRLSPDGQSLSGDYKFNVLPLNSGASRTWSLFDHGTWQARKQQEAEP
jgi:hypothetical protein